MESEKTIPTPFFSSPRRRGSEYRITWTSAVAGMTRVSAFFNELPQSVLSLGNLQTLVGLVESDFLIWEKSLSMLKRTS